jgi:dephospho-CoA kinase
MFGSLKRDNFYMIILGVTGSIGSGKSFVCKCLTRIKGVKLFSADDEVHRIMRSDKKVISQIAKLAPEAVSDGKINRVILGNVVFSNPSLRQQLEDIIYPTLQQNREKALLHATRERNIKVLVFDIPLLFERNLSGECDFILTVHCRKTIQKQRVLRRNKMTEEKFEKINSLQLPPQQKILFSDFAINSGLEKAATIKKVKQILQQIM